MNYGEIVIDTFLPLKPVPKGRPRATIRNGKILVYTPKTSARFEAEVKQLTRYAVRQRNETDDLAVRVRFYTRDSRSDIDNFLKSLFDGCNEVVWNDDKQVTELDARLYRKSRNTGIDFRVTVTRTTED